MIEIQNLENEADWEAVWEAQKAADAPRLFILKRAPTCATGRVIEGYFRTWLEALPPEAAEQLKVVSVDVVEYRPLSQKIEKDTLIKHESPQTMLFGPGRRRIWNASHWHIEADNLDKALKKALQ